MRAIQHLFATSCLIVALAPHNSCAQEQIPRELALALIPNGATEGGEIMVGKLPPDLAASLTLPPGGRTLGPSSGTMPLSSVPLLWSPGDPISSMRACQPAGPGNALSYQYAGADSAQDVTLVVTKATTPGCYQIDLRATARGARR